ncbi:type III pantothenate kinase [Marinomonas agarivorans]|nr:type III pantothenate kinase [Marinomonas agarivorans]
MFANNNVLVVDAGNSNIKLTAFVGDEITTRRSVSDVNVTVLKGLQFFPRHICFASVRDESKTKMILKNLKDFFGESLPIYTLSSLYTLYDLKNPYDDPNRLGVDRWLSVIAARSESLKPTVVVDAGTALKIEFLDDDGYTGGFITPGFKMMTNMLQENTGKINITEGRFEDQGPVIRNTEAAVFKGCWQMVLAFVDRIYREHRERKFIFTGGYGSQIMDELGIEAHYNQDLVAQGAKLMGDKLVMQK